MKKTKKKIRYIGDTKEMEVEFPKGPKFKIYADTETFTSLPNGAKPWAETKRKIYNSILSASTQIPGLLVWTCQSIKRDGKEGAVIDGDGITDNSLILETDEFGNITNRDHEKFFDVLRRVYANKHVPVVYFHNANYDLTCIIPIWLRLDPDLKIYFYSKPGNRKFLRGAIESKKYQFKAELDDTQLYKGRISIAKMGSELGYPKIKGVPYSISELRLVKGQLVYIDLKDGQEKTYPLKDYIEYAERDVEIMRRYDTRLTAVKDRVGKRVVEDDEAGEKQQKRFMYDKTQASHSKSLFNRYLARNGYGVLDQEFRFPIKKDDYDSIVISNMGGYTTYNKEIHRYECSDDEEIRYVDCNSMYPWIMTQPVPWRRILNKPPVKCSEGYTTGRIISVTKCTWKKQYAFLGSLPISKDRISGDLDISKKKKFYISDDYLEFIKGMADIEYELHDTKYQENTCCIKDFIERLYIQRREIKEELKLGLKRRHATSDDKFPDEPEWVRLNSDQEGVKIIMNSLYGKFCEKAHHCRSFYSTLTDLRYKRYQTPVPEYVCILTGCYITYMARMTLLGKIKLCVDEGGKIIYSDTDSVIFACPKDVNHEVVFGVDTGGLGEGKLEGTFDTFVNNGVKKKYFLMNRQKQSIYKYAMSGINKDFVKSLESALDSGDPQVIDDIIYIFDPKNNVVLKKLKTASVRNFLYNQELLYETDYVFNPYVDKINGEVTVEDGKYKLVRYEVDNE